MDNTVCYERFLCKKQKIFAGYFNGGFFFPAFDIDRSSTRREELLLSSEELARVWTMRRMLGVMMSSPPNGAGMGAVAATEAIVNRLARTKTNQEFLETLNRDLY